MADNPPPYSELPQKPPPGECGQQQPYPQQQQQPYPQQQQQQPLYPQQQQPYSQQSGPTVVVVNNVQYKKEPVHTVCQYCHQQVLTNVNLETGTFAWLLCFGLCVFGLDCGCCLIPFCLDDCKDAVHHCPNCDRVVGRYSRV